MNVLSVPRRRSPGTAPDGQGAVAGVQAEPGTVPAAAGGRLFYLIVMRTADGYPPVWTMRASVIYGLLFTFGALAGGLAAWAGAREGRRKTADLLATTPRAAWSRLSVALAGTLCWLLLAFLAGVAVLYVQTALQATWGGPPLWPVLVGTVGVTMSTVIGFTCGTVFPGRFTAPLVALGLAVLFEIGLREALAVRVLPVGVPPANHALRSPATSHCRPALFTS